MYPHAGKKSWGFTISATRTVFITLATPTQKPTQMEKKIICKKVSLGIQKANKKIVRMVVNATVVLVLPNLSPINPIKGLPTACEAFKTAVKIEP